MNARKRMRRSARLFNIVKFGEECQDCLFEIFDRLNLADLLNLRLQCRTLNNAVCNYLPQIKELSIVYTEYGPEGIPSKNLDEEDRPRNPGDTYFFSDWLDKDVTDFTRKFIWRKDLIVIFGREKFQKFLHFINKLAIQNIKKLSLIIDSNPNQVVTLSPASELLKLCPKVETLFLERATRRRVENTLFTDQYIFKAENLRDLFDTITGLASLSKLHFFSWPHPFSEIYLTPPHTMEPSTIPDDQINQMFSNFLSTMFQKLRIFGFNHRTQIGGPVLQAAHLVPLLGQRFENILELGLEENDCLKLVNSGVKFPNLRSLSVFHGGFRFERFNIERSFEKLTTLRFYNEFLLSEQTMLKLNSLQNLETLSAFDFAVSRGDFDDGHFRRNQTIKHIEVEEVYRRSTDVNVPARYLPLYSFTDFFQALETVATSPTREDKVIYDRNTFTDLRIETL